MESAKPQGTARNRKRSGALNRRRTRSGGQAMAEYAILIMFVFLAFFGMMAIFLDHVGDYYMNIIKIVALPFP